MTVLKLLLYCVQLKNTYVSTKEKGQESCTEPSSDICLQATEILNGLDNPLLGTEGLPEQFEFISSLCLAPRINGDAKEEEKTAGIAYIMASDKFTPTIPPPKNSSANASTPGCKLWK